MGGGSNWYASASILQWRLHSFLQYNAGSGRSQYITYYAQYASASELRSTVIIQYRVLPATCSQVCYNILGFTTSQCMCSITETQGVNNIQHSIETYPHFDMLNGTTYDTQNLCSTKTRTQTSCLKRPAHETQCTVHNGTKGRQVGAQLEQGGG